MTIKITIPNEQTPQILAVLQEMLSGNAPAKPTVHLSATAGQKPQPESTKVETTKKTEAVKVEPTKTAAPQKTEPVKAEEVKKVEPATEITVEQIRAVAAAKKDTHREQIKELLAEFNTKSITTLSTDDYADFFAKLNAL